MQKKIGILGFGVVGKSALNFLQNYKQNNKTLKLKHLDAVLDSVKFDVWDQNLFNASVFENLNANEVDLFDSAKLSMKDFIDLHDLIIPSPGVNLNDFYSVREKFICELDILGSYFKKPVIAVTGSLGKTTTTKLFGILLSKVKQSKNETWFFNKLCQLKPFVGGNIGLGMLEAIDKQDEFDAGVLELSSFQLEFSKYFAPDLALFTNCFPNHLDRHKTLKNYFDSKFNLFKYQNERQFSLFSGQILQDDVRFLFIENVKSLKSNVCLVFESEPDFDFLRSLNLKSLKIFYKQGNKLMHVDMATSFCHADFCHPEFDSGSIFDLSILPEVTFIQNWIMIISGLYLLGADLIELQSFFETEYNSFLIDEHHHRVEHFVTIKDVKFYDDSKATVIQSTLAAVKRLACKGPVILILGGLNKGVDRSPLIKELEKVKELKKAYCFGPNCSDFGLFSCNLNSLEEIVFDIEKIMQPGDQVLFSPSGTSFDFYQNYKHRGKVFQELILKMK